MADGSGSSRGVPERYEAGGHETAGAGNRDSDPKKQVRWGTRTHPEVIFEVKNEDFPCKSA